MIVANHFDVRWVDGYSAVSDVPSSLAAVIEKLAADLPSSDDRIELAVRDVRRSDGTMVWIGLLRFVVAVSSTPRPLGYLHAAVLPGSYCLDLDSWRALVARRYGAHPEERIRALYEELAESTKDTGRDRLHALAIRTEDVNELVEQIPDEEPPASLPRAYTRPGSRPPKGTYPRPSSPGIALVPAPAPRLRPSQPALQMAVRVVDLPAPAAESAADTEEMKAPLRDEQELANDVTQPMTAPSGTAAPLSGEHRQHEPPAPRAQRVWWVAGAMAGAMALLLGAVGWLGYRHVVLVGERDRLADQLSKGYPDRAAWERDRVELERVRQQLDERIKADQTCQRQVDQATQTCVDSLGQAREQARTNGDRADQLREAVQLKANELLDANSKLTKLKSDLTVAAAGKEEAERLYHEEQRRGSELVTARDAEIKRLKANLDKRDEQLRLLCKGLQSPLAGAKPPKECQGIK